MSCIALLVRIACGREPDGAAKSVDDIACVADGLWAILLLVLADGMSLGLAFAHVLPLDKLASEGNGRARDAGRAGCVARFCGAVQRTNQVADIAGVHASGRLHCALLGENSCFTFVNMRKDPEARRAVLLLISRGMISVREATQLVGVSRQLVYGWCKSAGISTTRARQTRIAAAFRKALHERR